MSHNTMCVIGVVNDDRHAGAAWSGMERKKCENDIIFIIECRKWWGILRYGLVILAKITIPMVCVLSRPPMPPPIVVIISVSILLFVARRLKRAGGGAQPAPGRGIRVSFRVERRAHAPADGGGSESSLFAWGLAAGRLRVTS